MKPGVTRTHNSCRPPQLVVQLDEDRRESLTPKSGEHFAVSDTDGKVELARVDE